MSRVLIESPLSYNEPYEIRKPLIIINLSLPRRRESSDVKGFWIPAFAGMTFLEAAIILIEVYIQN
jgi:hypothetical protein